jgi:hypothetical protein
LSDATGTQGERGPHKQPGERYSVDTYGNAIERACLKAGIPELVSWVTQNGLVRDPG